jgi:hypothetical protein
MYRIVDTIENNRAQSHIAEVSFHPSGSSFAVTYEDIDEVRIFDARTRRLLQVLENPESQIDLPHGVLFTEKYLLVSNAHNFRKPGTINVYRNSDAIKKPIQIFETPFSHLREPHSMALRDGRLVVTYAENVAPSGAIVSYAFNEETGKITGPLDKTETWFSEHGDAKGLCFNADGTKIFVTFKSDRQQPSVVKWLYWALASDLPVPARLFKFSRILKHAIIIQSSRLSNYFPRNGHGDASVELEKPNPRYVRPTKNGIAIFPISTAGKIARCPERVIVREHFCRLENIHIHNRICAVTDTVNHLLLLYDLAKEQNFTSPIHTKHFGKATPHAAKFSPDGRMLVISSLGRRFINQHLGSGAEHWESPREDKIFVLEH